MSISVCVICMVKANSKITKPETTHFSFFQKQKLASPGGVQCADLQ